MPLETYPLFLLGLVVSLYLVYMLAFFTASLALGVHENHYVFGYGKPIFSFTLKNVKFSIAWFIPILGLARIRAVVDGKLVNRRYPWQFEFVSKTKRLVVTLSGAVALILTSIVLYIADVYTTPQTLITRETVNTSGISPSVWARTVGFENGDHVIAINGEDYTEWGDLNAPALLRDSTTTYTVLRNGKQVDLTLGVPPKEISPWREPFLSLNVPFEVGIVHPGSAADAAGLQKGDRIVKVNDRNIVSRNEMIQEFETDEDLDVTLHVIRDKKTSDTLLLNATLTDDRRLGISVVEDIQYTVRDHSFVEAVVKGSTLAFNEVAYSTKALLRPLFGTERNTLSGPISIAQNVMPMYTRRAASAFLWYGIWNFLPIPLAVFWEIIPLISERITRRKYSYKAFDTGLQAGWIILITLMMLTFGLDMVKLFS